MMKIWTARIWTRKTSTMMRKKSMTRWENPKKLSKQPTEVSSVARPQPNNNKASPNKAKANHKANNKEEPSLTTITTASLTTTKTAIKAETKTGTTKTTNKEEENHTSTTTNKEATKMEENPISITTRTSTTRVETKTSKKEIELISKALYLFWHFLQQKILATF